MFSLVFKCAFKEMLYANQHDVESVPTQTISRHLSPGPDSEGVPHYVKQRVNTANLRTLPKSSPPITKH